MSDAYLLLLSKNKVTKNSIETDDENEIVPASPVKKKTKISLKNRVHNKSQEKKNVDKFVPCNDLDETKCNKI